MAQSDLLQILTTLLDSPENQTRFDETWSQGRSAFGGLSAAFAVTAMRKRLPEDLPMRSLMVSFIAPIPPGDVYVETRVQRQGKNVIQLSANVISGGDSCLQAMGVFGRGREASAVPAPDKTDLPARDQGIGITEHTRRLPSFLRYFDGCWTGGGLPFSGNKETELGLWARHNGDLGSFPAEQICLIADIPPPVMLSHFTQATPASSLTWSLEFVIPPERITTDWFYLDFVMEAAAEGYTQQSGRIYTEEGKLCALTRQCMVYFEQKTSEKK